MNKWAVAVMAGATTLISGSIAFAADGGATYAKACALCHATGVGGAPKLADKAAWGPRLGSGRDALLAAVMKGKGAMPAKGGNAALPDADVAAAVDYMLGQAK